MMKLGTGTSSPRGGSVVCIDFYLAADGQHIDHMSTSLPRDKRGQLPTGFDTVQEAIGALTPALTRMYRAGKAPLTIMYTKHRAPTN